MEEKIKELIKHFEKILEVSKREIKKYEQQEYHFKDLDRYMSERSMCYALKGETFTYEHILDKLKAILESEE